MDEGTFVFSYCLCYMLCFACVLFDRSVNVLKNRRLVDRCCHLGDSACQWGPQAPRGEAEAARGEAEPAAFSREARASWSSRDSG